MDTHKVVAFQTFTYIDAEWQEWVEKARGSKEYCMGFAEAMREHTSYKIRVRQIKSANR